MTYATLGNNITGIDDLFVYLTTAVPSFIPILLFAIFLTITLAVWLGSKSSQGEGDPFTAMTVGGFMTTLVAFLLPMKDGLLKGAALGTCFAITAVFAVIFLIKRNRD